jgi:predicted RNase H-like HicB family nuclease
MEYTAIYEKTTTGYSAYVPDLPGCISTGASLEQAKRNMAEAIAFHVEGLKLHGYAIPEPTTLAEVVTVSS